jgi:hypothetical protein
MSNECLMDSSKKEEAQHDSGAPARIQIKSSQEAAASTKRHKSNLFETIIRYAELLSYLAVIAAVPAAIYQVKAYREESSRAAQEQLDDKRKEDEQAALSAKLEQQKARREEIDEARRVYREVYSAYSVFMELCYENPRLDCYSVPMKSEAPRELSSKEKTQQKILYTMVTEFFEVAWVNFNPSFKNLELDPDVAKFWQEQWQGWDAYMRKFLERPAYCQTYLEIRDEYDPGLVSYMNSIAPCAQGAPKSTPASTGK